MKKGLLFLAMIAMLLIPLLNVSSQDLSDPLRPKVVGTPIYLGPVVGYNRSLHSVDLASFVDDPLCPFFSNGTANGFYAGLSFEYLLGNVTDSKSSIIARALYNTMPASFTKEGDRYPSLVEDPSSPTGYTTVFSKTQHSIEVTYSMLTFEVMYKLNFLQALGVTVGPTFDFPMSKKLDQVYKLIEPDYVQFKRNTDPNVHYRYADNDRTIYVKEGDIPESSGFRLALKAGLQYEILLGRMYVVPAVYYNYALTKLTTTENWYVHALQMGVDVRFAF